MTSGAYRRCATYGCRKKAQDGKHRCPIHEMELPKRKPVRRRKPTLKATPNADRHIMELVRRVLREEGLIN